MGIRNFRIIWNYLIITYKNNDSNCLYLGCATENPPTRRLRVQMWRLHLCQHTRRCQIWMAPIYHKQRTRRSRSNSYNQNILPKNANWNCDADYLTLHIRVVGGWTRRVYAICQENFEKLQPYQSDQRILNQISSKLELIGKKADDSFKFQSLRWQMKAEDNLAFQAESCTVEISRISHDVTRQVLQLSPIEVILNIAPILCSAMSFYSISCKMEKSKDFLLMLHVLFLSLLPIWLVKDSDINEWSLQWFDNQGMELSTGAFYCWRDWCDTFCFSTPKCHEKISKRHVYLPSLFPHELQQPSRIYGEIETCIFFFNSHSKWHFNPFLKVNL